MSVKTEDAIVITVQEIANGFASNPERIYTGRMVAEALAKIAAGMVLRMDEVMAGFENVSG